MNSMKTYVVSNSLQAAEWQNSELVSGNVARKLSDIEAWDRGDIAMSGSPTTVRWLSAQTFKTGVLNLSYAPAKK